MATRKDEALWKNPPAGKAIKGNVQIRGSTGTKTDLNQLLDLPYCEVF